MDVFVPAAGFPQGEQWVQVPWIVQDVNTVIHVTVRDVDPPDSDPTNNQAQKPLTESTVPTFLSDLSVWREGPSIRVQWQVALAVEPDGFRLVGRQGELEWEVPVQSLGGNSFIASDDSYRLGPEGPVTYSLYFREPDGGWVLLASETLHLEAPELISGIQGVHPNPFNPHTTVAFSVGRPQNVRISVFDASGRLVVVLIDQVCGAGSHGAEWDGADASGRAVSSGTYLVRMETEGEVDSRKVVLVR
jgi:hypothetical protein